MKPKEKAKTDIANFVTDFKIYINKNAFHYEGIFILVDYT